MTRAVAFRLGGRSVIGRPVDTRAAWRDLFTATYPTLAGWVRRLVDDDETAHEIASEAFTRLMSHSPPEGGPMTHLRNERAASPDSDMNLRDLLEPLPQHQRIAVVLHYLAGMPIRDVALAVGRPEGTVKSDLYQARERLRAELDSSHD